MSSIIRSLVVKVGADINDFQKKMGSVAKDLEKTAKKWNALGQSLTKNITVPALAVGAALSAVTLKMAGYADDINTMATVTGISAKRLQELRYVASQTDTEFETIATSMGKFTKILGDAANKESEVGKLFGLLGVNLKDKVTGNLKPVNTLFFETINKLGGIKDETAQAMIASELFGRSFQDLIPLIKAGSGAVDFYTERANKLGLVHNQETLDRLAKFNDKYDEFKQRLQAAGVVLADKALPLFEKLGELAETRLIPMGEKLIDFVGRLIDKFAALSPEMQETVVVLGGIALASGPVITGFGNLISLLGKIPGLATTAANAVKGIVLAGSGMGGLIAGTAILGYATIKPKYDQYVADNQKKAETMAAINSGNLKGMDNVQKFLGGPIDTSKAMDAWKETVNSGSSEVKKAQEESDKWLTDFNKKWDEYIKSLETGSKTTDTAASKLEQFRDTVKSMVDTIKDQTRAFANFVGLFDTFERKSVSGTRLLNRLKAQVSAMMEWRSSLAALEKRGVNQQFLNDLRSMGPSAVDSINALSKMSDEQLKQYTGLYNQKFAIGGAESSKMVSANMKANTVIEKQINLTVTGSKGDAEVIANAIVKKLRAAGYAF